MADNQIHPTALVHPEAKLGSGNYVGPFCLIGPQVTIGNNNRFEAYVSIGTPAEHRDYFNKPAGKVLIGNDCVMREYVTINGSTHGLTSVGNSIVMLRGSHVGHDAEIADRANLSCNVMIGGHTKIGKSANIGLSSVVHQNRVIGAYSMVGMNSTVTRNTPPFVIAFGTPAEPQRVNRIGLQRSGVPEAELQNFENWFQDLRGSLDRLPNLQHSYSQYVKAYMADVESLQAGS